MGIWDNNNLILHLYSKKDLSDPKRVERIMTKENFTQKEYRKYTDTLPYFENKFAERILCFFSEYKDGILRPDRCDHAEPIRLVFDENNIRNYADWLTYPGAGFSFKKFKGLKYIAELENEQFPAAWFGKDRVIPRPETIFDYILELKMFFDKRSVQVRNKPLDFWLEMIRDISETIGADKGYFRDGAENVMLYRFGNLVEKDIKF